MSLDATNVLTNKNLNVNDVPVPIARADNRKPNELRTVTIIYDILDYAAGSLLFCIGKTKIIVAITIQQGVPNFLRGSSTGWLSAEYAMMPAATQVRTQRESTTSSRNGRSVEISRLIGRVLRTAVDLTQFGEKTIFVDCDVLQADGSTRAASITAAYLALQKAQDQLLEQRIIKVPFLRYAISAVSVAVVNNQVLLDPTYDEDSVSSSDINFIMTDSLEIVEIQGGAEKVPLSQKLFDTMREIATQGIQKLVEYQKKNPVSSEKSIRDKEEKLPLFSLGRRIQRMV